MELLLGGAELFTDTVDAEDVKESLRISFGSTVEPLLGARPNTGDCERTGVGAEEEELSSSS